MHKILITGGTGFIGRHLIPLLEKDGNQVSILSRNAKTANSFSWDVDKGHMDPNAIINTDTIVHLTGAGIADQRWTPKYKREIQDSRAKAANLLFDTLKKTKNHVKTLISASATGYYGDTGEAWVEEIFRAPEDFLGTVCTEWEKSAWQFETLGLRVVILRIGFVLAKDGGALPPLAMQVKLFVGAPLGSGDQYLSWIHINDLCRIISFAVTNEKVHGVFNAVSPSPVTNKMLVKKIASVLYRPVWPFSVPAFVMKMILGEKASIVLEGQRVSSEKIRMAGFEFNHVDLTKTLQELL